MDRYSIVITGKVLAVVAGVDEKRWCGCRVKKGGKLENSPRPVLCSARITKTREFLRGERRRLGGEKSHRIAILVANVISKSMDDHRLGPVDHADELSCYRKHVLIERPSCP